MRKVLISILLIFIFSELSLAQTKSNSTYKTPVFYQVSDFQLKFLLQSLEKRLKKDEFESKVEYKERVIQLLKDISLGDDKEYSLYNLWIPINTHIQYDAEIKAFKTYSGFDNFYFDRIISLRSLEIEKIKLFSDIPTTQTEFNSFQLSTLNLTLPMVADEAKNNKESIRIALYGTVFSYKNSDGFLFVPREYIFFNQKTYKLYEGGELKNLK